jgi:Calcineurin-like phosphoesterase
VPEAPETTAANSSRKSKAAAGWVCEKPGSWRQLMEAEPLRPGKQHSFAWLNPVPLWKSRNDRVARIIGDPVGQMREEWLTRLPHGDGDRIVDVPAGANGSISFLVMGDTGEGDASQFALAPPLQRLAEGTAFLAICSDVIYPAGGIDEYLYNFFKPYRNYNGPIYAVPGNHDWYDNCTGFMYWFCGWNGESAPKPRGFLPWLLWRRPPSDHREKTDCCRKLRPNPAQQAQQPGPYFVIHAGPLKLVGIDTGIKGGLDKEQGRWLRRVSEGPEPKILLTGKPLYVDGDRHCGEIDGGGTVNKVVTNPANNYIAAIGGDIHNYQRYPARLEDGRTRLYLVSGGGGAFMHATHTIDNLDNKPELHVSEEDFRCYPLRGDSLSRYSQLYRRKLLGKILFTKRIPPDEASRLIGKKRGIEVTRESARNAPITRRARWTAALLRILPKRGRGGLHVPFSEWLDFDEPPFFKNFLHIEAKPQSVRIRCFGVTGCGEEEENPTLEDDLRADLQPDGTWKWTLPPN